MCSRKDYRAIADAILEALDCVAEYIADYFARDNSRFDRERFYAACGVNMPTARDVRDRAAACTAV